MQWLFSAQRVILRRINGPGAFALFKQKKLPDVFFLLLVFQDEITQTMNSEITLGNFHKKPEWSDFSKHLYYQNGDFTQEKGYLELTEKLNDFDEKMVACITRFFYLATPPQNYETILNFLSSTKLSEGCGQKEQQMDKNNYRKTFWERFGNRD